MHACHENDLNNTDFNEAKLKGSFSAVISGEYIVQPHKTLNIPSGSFLRVHPTGDFSALKGSINRDFLKHLLRCFSSVQK